MNGTAFYFVVLIFITAGVVILKSLRKLNMNVAFGLFSVLFVVLSLYFPVVLNSMVTGIFYVSESDTLSDAVLSSYFAVALDTCYVATYTAAAVTVIIMGIAALIASVNVVQSVVQFFRRSSEKSVRIYTKRKKGKIICPASRPRRIYIEFCRLLN